MSFFAPDEETLPPDELAKLQRRKLAVVVDAVRTSNVFYQRRFQDIEFDAESDELDRLPLTTRDDLQKDQRDHPPYGTVMTYPSHRYTRLHQTSGSLGTPLRMLDTPDSWSWWKRCWGIIYAAAEITQDDRFLFPYSFGPFIGFWGAFESAAERGNLVLPCGGMTTTARLNYMVVNEATVVCCTPTYALHMAEVAEAQGIDLPAASVRALIVAGEPGGSIPATRQRIETAWGARVYDHPGMTEVGPWGFECHENPGSVHVMESEFIAEVIDPDTRRLVRGDVTGELVLTNLGRLGMPLIRYRTGDQITLTRDRCRCGRCFARAAGGIKGRLDDLLFVRGNNVFPSAVEGILRTFDEVAEFRIVVQQAGAMSDLLIEVDPKRDAVMDGLAMRIERAVRDLLHFKPLVVIGESGSLPRFEVKARRLVRPSQSGTSN